MDQQIFKAINDFAQSWSWLQFLGQDYFLYLFLVVAVVLLWVHNKKYLWISALSILIARGIIAEVLKRIVDRPRPDISLPDTSFPSGHGTIYFAVAFMFWGTKYFWPMVILATLGSIGRVFLGVHYPSDVLVGAVIGAGTSLVLSRLFKNRILS